MEALVLSRLDVRSLRTETSRPRKLELTMVLVRARNSRCGGEGGFPVEIHCQ